MLVWFAIPCGPLWADAKLPPDPEGGSATRFSGVLRTSWAEVAALRHQSSIISLSWIPSRAVEDGVRIRD